MIMAIFDPKPKDAREVRFSYTTEDHLASLHEQLTFSSCGDEEEVILEVFSMEEKAYMATSKTYSNSFF